MARAVSLRRPRISAAPARRKRIWARNQEEQVFPGDQAFSLLAGFRAVANSDQPVGSTIARIRGTAQVAYGAITGASATIGVTVGIIIETRGQAPADLPRPVADAHEDWMFWKWFPLTQQAFGTPDGQDTYAFEFDTKAMRKMEELQQDCWLVFDVDGPAGATL